MIMKYGGQVCYDYSGYKIKWYNIYRPAPNILILSKIEIPFQSARKPVTILIIHGTVETLFH